ncbi:hypothetical protein [Streptomyces sp. AC602_WCS936]|uniref:hypothetical protein n=1 Tax=Streptomyces sp. AC602_WCS936 TaxID=2823685 RepID=UPI001C27FFB5|nr:hypothetical protein [Streptomyces sp. AC602_WCS936]
MKSSAGRKLLYGAAAGGALMLTVATAAPATALNEDACTMYGCYSNDGWGSGFGRWVPNGDKMWVCDRSADGWSVVVQATVLGKSVSNKWVTTGNNTCAERSYGNVTEGYAVNYMTCLGDYSEQKIVWSSCGTEQWGRA